MKKLYVLLTLGLFLFHNTAAQQPERIKPSKIITATQIATDEYDTIEVYNDIHIILTPGDAPSLNIEANDNLLEAIDISVHSGALSLRTIKAIRGKKVLNITINYSQKLKRIVLHNSAKLSAPATVALNEEITVEANDETETFMTLDANIINIVTTDKSKSALDLKASTINLKINSNGNHKGIVNAETLYANLHERSKMTLEGNISNLILETNSNSFFSGNALAITNASIVAKSTSNIHIRALEMLNINAIDKSKVYVYGAPKLNLDTFEGEAALLKIPD